MNKDKMTDEQKYWYLKGYLDCFLIDITLDYKISEDEARKMLTEMLLQRIKISS